MRLRALRHASICILLVALLSMGTMVATASPLSVATGSGGSSPGDQVAGVALQYVGTPYSWGGASPAGFDCTGFVLWVFSQFGEKLPHNEAGQLDSGPSIAPDALKPGDILVFANTYRYGLSHTGIYVGEGQFVHAADEPHGVMVSNLWDSYWGPRLVGASRPLA